MLPDFYARNQEGFGSRISHYIGQDPLLSCSSRRNFVLGRHDSMCKGPGALGSITVWKSWEEVSVARGGNGVSSPGKTLLVQY